MKARIHPWLQGALIVLAGGWVFWPALRGDWIWDDRAEVAGNLLLRDPRGLAKIWLAPTGADYFPLKSTVQWLEWQAWGEHRLGYHLVTLGLHLASALMFWRLLRRLLPGCGGAWLGGLLFAIHPVTVESVAWITELKNTLSLPPLLLALGNWADWAEAASAGRTAGGAYRKALAWFLIALLCKTSVVMFPVVLLLFLAWKRGRVDRGALEASAPFFALAAIFGAVTLGFQERHAILGTDLAIGGFGSRLAAAGCALVFYAGKLLFPVDLIPNYPRWQVVPPSLEQLLPWAALAAIAAWLAAKPRRAVEFGLGCFVVNLLPVLGFLPMAYLRISWVADHLAYVAALGLIGVAAGGAAAAGGWIETKHPRWYGAAGAAVLAGCLLLGTASRRQAAIYRHDASFWGYTVAHNPRSWLAQSDLGLVLADSGQLETAIARDRESIRLQPRYPEARNNLGNALAGLGRFPEAIAAYGEALRLRPDYLDARRNLGSALAQSGRLPEAMGQYAEVLRQAPGDAQTHCYLGITLAEAGRPAEAMAEYAAALRLNPELAEAHYRLGNALGNGGRLPEAMQEYQAALRLQPAYAEARANLGLALAVAHRTPQAIAELERAVRDRPAYAEAQAYLGYALAQAGRYPEAIAHYQAALRLGSRDPDVHYNLAGALRAAGRGEEARAEFDRAAELSAGAGQAHHP